MTARMAMSQFPKCPRKDGIAPQPARSGVQPNAPVFISPPSVTTPSEFSDRIDARPLINRYRLARKLPAGEPFSAGKHSQEEALYEHGKPAVARRGTHSRLP
jgi:hypothetical protein